MMCAPLLISYIPNHYSEPNSRLKQGPRVKWSQHLDSNVSCPVKETDFQMNTGQFNMIRVKYLQAENVN